MTLRRLYSKDQCINEWKQEQNAITSLYYRRSNDVYIFTKLREWQGHTLIWIRLERLECERCVLQRSDCVVCGTWNNLNVTRVLWQNANVCVVMKVKPYSIDAQNRIDETLIKNSKKHDLNWLAFWWRYLSTFLHHTEFFWVELGSTATIEQMCVNRSWH